MQDLILTCTERWEGAALGQEWPSWHRIGKEWIQHSENALAIKDLQLRDGMYWQERYD